MHWVDGARDVAPEMVRITDARPARSCGRSPGSATSARTSARPVADEVVGIELRRELDQRRPEVDYDKTVATIQEVVDGYPGLYRDVQTYLKERIREVLTGAGEAIVVRIFGPDLETLRDEGATRSRRSWPGSTASSTPRRARGRHPAGRGRGRPRRGPGDTGSSRRHPPSRGHAARERGGRRHLPRRQGLRRHVWSTPETRDSIDDLADAPIDTPNGGVVPLDRLADVHIAPCPT